jgi:hypothetical protein
MTAIPFENVEWTSDGFGRIQLGVRDETIHSVPVPTHWLLELAPEAPSWITRFTAEIQRLADLPRDWNSYGAEAPHQDALRSCTGLLEDLWNLGTRPTRIGPLADGGVFLSVVAPRGRFDADCYNSGETVIRVRRADEQAQMGETYADVGRGLGDIAKALREIGAAKSDVSAGEEPGSSV